MKSKAALLTRITFDLFGTHPAENHEAICALAGRNVQASCTNPVPAKGKTQTPSRRRSRPRQSNIKQ